MTDKELLELAAKAAGFTFEDHYDDDEYWPWVEETQDFWNPLADDGDALRLMVELRMDVAFHPRCVSVGDAELEFYGDDPCAATRRGIVEAAAEIGKEMETSDNSESDPVHLGNPEAS